MPPGYPFTADFVAQYPEAAIDFRFRTAVNISPGAKLETSFTLYDQSGAHPLPLSDNAQESAFNAELAAFVRGVQSGISPLPVQESVAVMRVIHRVKDLLEAQEKDSV